MPAQDNRSTISRQWQLLRLLPKRPPGKTASQLRDQLEDEGYATTKRTVERDLRDLSPLFPIASNEKSIPYGWHWSADKSCEIVGMDLSEAVSLSLLEDVLRQIVPTSFTAAVEGKFAQARGKLAAIPGVPAAQWTDLVRYIPPGLPFLPPAIHGEVLEAVQESLLHRKQLLVSYRSGGNTEVKALTLHPLALIQQGARSYLLATANDYETPFLYALHRMDSAEILEESSTRPTDFTLDDYLAKGGAQFGAGKLITLKARISDELCKLLAETPMAPDQKITTRTGTHTLTATVPDSWQLHFWILSQGPAITVVQPTTLLKTIADRLRAASENYES